MIIDYTTKNFLSLKDEAELSMVATSDKSNVEDNVFGLNKFNLLKCAVVYGANGSGKSNFISSLAFMRSLIIGQAKLTDHSFHLDKGTHGKASFFEIVFINNDKKRYRYGFESTEKKIVSEWLFFVPSTKEAELFTRDGQDIQVGELFKEGRKLVENTREDKLFLDVVAEFNGKIALSIIEWFRQMSIISGFEDNHLRTLRLINEKGELYKTAILDILHSFDIQLEDFSLRERTEQALLPENEGMPASLKSLAKAFNSYIKKEKLTPPPQVLITRKLYKNKKVIGVEEMDLLENESHGTKKLFALAGRVVEAIDSGHPLIVDELETQLHPLVTKEIIKIFNSKEKNSKNAQLIFTTHDTNLLRGNHLRRDQVWFAEKDKYGATHIYSLVEYKDKPRKDANLERDYINGRYGAIPFLGDFKTLCKE